MPRANRAEPMPVRHWSRCGILLTARCSAACESCYLSCRPGEGADTSAERAVAVWRGLVTASPHGCRVHLTGGEPMLVFDTLRQVLAAGRDAGLAAPEVETNGGWADDPASVEERLADLDAAGMGDLAISADPFHQQFVPIDRVRRLAKIAAGVLGASRVRVRWADWLDEGADTGRLPSARRRELFADWLERKNDRLNGRAAERLADLLPARPAEAYAGRACGESLLRGKGVHILPDGGIVPGVCAGLLLGRADSCEGVGAAWRDLDHHHGDRNRRPILTALAAEGPVGLLSMAEDIGFDTAGRWASKCHLCWSIRRALFEAGRGAGELGPAWIYRQA